MNPDEFNITEIERMNPEFEKCQVCDGSGYTWNGIEIHRCTVCAETGEVVKEVKNELLA